MQGPEWFLLRDTSDLESFVGSLQLPSPDSLPVLACHTIFDGGASAIYVDAANVALQAGLLFHHARPDFLKFEVELAKRKTL